MVSLFAVLGAAVFAKPTITKVEKVIGLIHKVGSSGAECPAKFARGTQHRGQH